MVGNGNNPNLVMVNHLKRNSYADSLVNLSHMSEISLLNGINEHDQYKENKPFDESVANHELVRHHSLKGRQGFNRPLRMPHGQPKIAKFTPLSPRLRADGAEYPRDKTTPERMFKIVFAGDAVSTAHRQ